uniref:Reticulon-like protein n=1 Tax=Caenorhabditis tropicalis TaxID=1561998 RepID=A0A1I7U8D6_9PELO
MAQTRFNNKKFTKQPTWVPATDFVGKILDVIYWRDAKKSAVVLSLALLALFILAKFPLLTVITYTLLLALGAAAGFRLISSVYKKVEAQIKKTDSENPFSEILSQDLSLPQEKVHAQADVFVEHATCIANTLKKLVFVESPLESIKFGLILWSLTYVASWFSGFTLAILGLLGVFSIPKLYEANQEAIDPHLATISGHLKNVQNL